jgi:aldose 1-epimerase
MDAVVYSLLSGSATLLAERGVRHLAKQLHRDSIVLRASKSNASATILTTGASLQSLIHPDGTDILLGWEHAAAYQHQSCFSGCIVGPVANRTYLGRLDLSDGTHQLTLNHNANNNNAHHHHGGFEGLHKRSWLVYSRSFNKHYGDSVTLACELRDGHEGYPSSRLFFAEFTLIDAGPNAASLDLKLSSINLGDIPSAANPSLHPYLAPHGNTNATERSANDLLLQLPNSDTFLPVDHENIPTGDIEHVTSPSNQYRDLRKYPERIKDKAPIGGFDSYFFLNNPNGEEAHKHVSEHKTAPDARNEMPMELAARLIDEQSNREISVLTDAPGIQVFTGGVPRSHGKHQVEYGRENAVAIEAHWPPDATHLRGPVPGIELPPESSSSFRTRYLMSYAE